MIGIRVAAAVCACAFSPVLRADDPAASRWTWADRPFNGVWVFQPELATFDLRLTEFNLDRSVFRRTDCRTGPLEIPTDGAPHKIKGQPFFDTATVRVSDSRHVELLESVAARAVWRGKYTVSADGRSMVLEFQDDRASKPVTGVLEYARDGVASSDRSMSGTWRPRLFKRLTETELSVSFGGGPGDSSAADPEAPDPRMTFRLSQNDGRTAEGKLDAQPYPLSGYLPNATVSINRLEPNVLQINRSQNGQLVEISRLVVSEDGKSMTLGQIDAVCQAKTTFTLRRKDAE